MKLTLLALMLSPVMALYTLFDFSPDADMKNWRVVDDVVMGGMSSGSFTLTEEGHAQFSGNVSLENNGGFSSVRYVFDEKDVSEFKTVKLRLKGDGKKYQFRIQSRKNDYYSYITTFKTSGEWEEVDLKLKDFYPSFRGRKLDMANYSGETMVGVTFLIANYKNESFELLIDKIELK